MTICATYIHGCRTAQVRLLPIRVCGRAWVRLGDCLGCRCPTISLVMQDSSVALFRRLGSWTESRH